MCSLPSTPSARPVFEVLSAGLQATMQDSGRAGARKWGVPRGGALDGWALRAANTLLGNSPDAAVIEVLLAGLVLRSIDTATIALGGADLGVTLDGTPLAPWATWEIKSGQTLACANRRSGARMYLAIYGGFAAEPILGSRSTYLPGGWGGFAGRALRAGDLLHVYEQPGAPGVRYLSPDRRPPYSSFPTLRCLPGPHRDLFPSETLQAFVTSPYTLTQHCNRIGYRLHGAPLPALEGLVNNLPSLGVLPGVVQIPPRHQPILLMADAQTTGGYPIPAVVINADLPLAAQLLPGDQVLFQWVASQTALAALHEQAAWLEPPFEVDIDGTPV